MIGRRLVTGRAVEGGKKSTKRTNWHCGRDGLAGERDDDTDNSDGSRCGRTAECEVNSAEAKDRQKRRSPRPPEPCW